MRLLFADGRNSMWHISFGILAFEYNFIIPLFLIYQFVLKRDSNSLIDVAEFAVGYAAIYLFSKARVRNEPRDSELSK
jgi:hypothetical protein